MAHYVDFYLGGFLILCGFSLSLLNLRRIVKGSKIMYPAVLLSENVLLMSIGIAFISRSLYELSPLNTEMDKIEERSSFVKTGVNNCGFMSILMSYGPLVVSLVNSFLSLIIDNYMHYKMISEVKRMEDESVVREINNLNLDSEWFKNLFLFMKKYFTFFTVSFQWVVPLVIALSMYSIEIKEMTLVDGQRSFDDSCMALINVNKENCSEVLNWNNTFQLSQFLPKTNYLQAYNLDVNDTSKEKIDNIVKNVYNLLSNLNNETFYSDINVTSEPLLRKNKSFDENCMKICFMENKKLLLYMFGVSIISYFVPITISTIILTKIHIMDVKNKNIKTYVNRELLYNILFWTPVMFDTFLSITLCSYTMSGMRTSIFNVIANVYQAVKNFMNTKYFKDNSISPV